MPRPKAHAARKPGRRDPAARCSASCTVVGSSSTTKRLMRRHFMNVWPCWRSMASIKKLEKSNVIRKCSPTWCVAACRRDRTRRHWLLHGVDSDQKLHARSQTNKLSRSRLMSVAGSSKKKSNRSESAIYAPSALNIPARVQIVAVASLPYSNARWVSRRVVVHVRSVPTVRTPAPARLIYATHPYSYQVLTRRDGRR